LIETNSHDPKFNSLSSIVRMEIIETNIPYQPHCFWSGREARIESYSQSSYLCDNNVSYISYLFEKGKTIQDGVLKKELDCVKRTFC